MSTHICSVAGGTGAHTLPAVQVGDVWATQKTWLLLQPGGACVAVPLGLHCLPNAERLALFRVAAETVRHSVLVDVVLNVADAAAPLHDEFENAKSVTVHAVAQLHPTHG